MIRVGDKRSVYIYGLFNPDTGRLFYIGRTRTPQSRLSTLISEAKMIRYGTWGPDWEIWCCNSQTSEYIRGLLFAGMTPEMEILEEVHGEDWREAESWWIQYLRFLGCELTNTREGGQGNPDIIFDQSLKRWQQLVIRKILEQSNPAQLVSAIEAATHGAVTAAELLAHLIPPGYCLKKVEVCGVD